MQIVFYLFNDFEVYLQGEEKFTFVEGCKNPRSVTVLLKGSTKYVLNQLKDALRDGLRSITNAIEDGSFNLKLNLKLSLFLFRLCYSRWWCF
jgi:chaperonin GroEL (HSP60 family)